MATLGYWNIRGWAAPIRYLLEYAGAEYVNKLYKPGPPPGFPRESWTADKYNLGLDFPNLPYYIDDEIKLTQSGAIWRYLARKHGLDAKDNKTQARCEMLVEQIRDNQTEFVRLVIMSNHDPKNKKEWSDALPAKMKLFSDFLGSNQFVAGDYVTYADFVLFEFLENQSFYKDDVLKGFSNLVEFHKRIRSLDPIDKYFKSPKAITNFTFT